MLCAVSGIVVAAGADVVAVGVVVVAVGAGVVAVGADVVSIVVAGVGRSISKPASRSTYCPGVKSLWKSFLHNPSLSFDSDL